MNILILLAPIIFFIPNRAKSTAAAAMIIAGAITAAVSSAMSITGYGSELMPELDRLSAPFVLAIAIVGTAASVYAIGATRGTVESKSSIQISLHFSCMVILFYAMIGVLTAQSSYQFLLWWELMTLSSFVLVIFEASRKEVLHAGISYLLLMHISFFFLLSGFACSNSGADMWSNNSIAVWLLFLIGFGLKSALFPLHIWLPVTYLNTPSHVTVMMSGVMINMGIYGIMRTTLGAADPYTVGMILFCMGIISGIFGIIKAALHTGLKRLLAYSSVENMGIITMAVGLGAIGKATNNSVLIVCGFAGAMLHMLNHSAYKSMMFMAAGSLEKATGKSDLNRMGGLLRKMPSTGLVFAIGALALCALPPFSGFFSEYTILSGLITVVADGSQPIIGICAIVSLAIIGGLAVLTFSKAFTMIFLGQARSCSVRDAQEVNATMIGAYALPLTCVVAGGLLFSYMFLADGALWQTMLHIEITMAIAVAICIGLWFIRRLLQRSAKIDTQPTWGCAFAAPNKKMQYTSSSVSRELEYTIASNAKVEETTLTELYPTTEPQMQTNNTDRTNLVITRASQRMLHRWTARLALFQTGKTNHYILHALLFLILIFLLSLTGAI